MVNTHRYFLSFYLVGLFYCLGLKKYLIQIYLKKKKNKCLYLYVCMYESINIYCTLDRTHVAYDELKWPFLEIRPRSRSVAWGISETLKKFFSLKHDKSKNIYLYL